MPDDKPIYKQISHYIIVAPDGRQIPISLDNRDYRKFQAQFEAGEVNLEIAYDPMAPRTEI